MNWFMYLLAASVVLDHWFARREARRLKPMIDAADRRIAALRNELQVRRVIPDCKTCGALRNKPCDAGLHG